MGRRSSSSNGGGGGGGSRRRNHTQARTIYPIKMASSTSTPTSSASSRTSSAQSGGSFLSNLTSNITSIALGHALGRAISSFFEGKTPSFSAESDKVSNIPVQTIYPNKQKVNPKCMDYHKLWEQCLSINDSKQSSCTDYMEMLKSCNEQEEMRF